MDGERLFRAVDRAVRDAGIEPAHARAGAHGEPPDAEHRGEVRLLQPPRQAGRGHRDRRFRHRILLAVLPEEAAGGLDQDRQLVRARHRGGSRTTTRSCRPSSRWRTRLELSVVAEGVETPAQIAGAARNWAATNTRGSTRARRCRPRSSSAAIVASRRRRRALVLGVDLQLLHLARERVAPDAEQARRLDAPSARVLQGLGR